MRRKGKLMQKYFLYAGILLMLIFPGFTGYYSEASSDVRKSIPGTSSDHGSRFEIYVSRLMSIHENERDTAVRNFINSFPNTPVVENDSIVSLYWFGKSKQVLINGDLQLGWSRPDTMRNIPCGENAFFHITYKIPSDSRLDYQFIVDSTVTTDPRNPVITPSGYGPHSEIAMPRFKPDPVKQFIPDVPHGSIDRKFKTACEPQKLGITGISAGGHMALLMIFAHPDVFQCGAGQSPTINDQLYKSFHSFLRKGKNNPLVHIYFDVGRYDLPEGRVSNLTFLQANEDFHHELEQNGIKHLFQVVNDGHEWANWRERTDDILIYFFGLGQ